MRKLVTITLIALVVVLMAAPAPAQAPTPPPTYEAAVLRTWKALHDKILVMAKDTQFPDDKLSWKPHPDSRSVMDEFRHVTIGLRMTSAVARGEKFDFEAQEKADARERQARAHAKKEDAKQGQVLKQLDGLDDKDPLGGL